MTLINNNELKAKIEEVVKAHLKEVGTGDYGKDTLNIEYICEGNLIGSLTTLFTEMVEGELKEFIIKTYKEYSNSGLSISYPEFLGFVKNDPVDCVFMGGKKYIREDLVNSPTPQKEAK